MSENFSLFGIGTNCYILYRTVTFHTSETVTYVMYNVVISE